VNHLAGDDSHKGSHEPIIVMIQRVDSPRPLAKLFEAEETARE
jgi:hypothetical protein